MENKKIFEIIDKFNAAGITNLSIKDGTFEISMCKDVPVAVAPAVTPTAVAHMAGTVPEPQEISGMVIKSPILGTFYGASSPDKPPFVTIGSKISKGDTVCVVEAMKMFNEVTSEFDGVVKEILVENGANIEYGQPLFILEG